MLASRYSAALPIARQASRFSATRGVATFTPSYPSFYLTPSHASPPTFFQRSFHPNLLSSAGSASSSKGRKGWKLAVSALASFGLVYSITSTDTLKLDAAPVPDSALPPGLSSIIADSTKQLVVDPDTNLSFPLYLPSPASFKTSSSSQNEPRFRLVGLGVRTVSFLRVRVYVAALYIDESTLQAHLSQSPPADKTLEQTVKEMIDQGTPAVIRIVPVRNTDFNHLRDGFIRALQNRLKSAIKQSKLQPDSPLESQFQQAIQQIKDSFPRGSVPKGSPLDLVIIPIAGSSRPARTSLSFEYDNQIFGQVQTGSTPADSKAGAGVDAGFTVARELLLAYFVDQNEISTPFKKSVREGMYHQLPAASA